MSTPDRPPSPGSEDSAPDYQTIRSEGTWDEARREEVMSNEIRFWIARRGLGLLGSEVVNAATKRQILRLQVYEDAVRQGRLLPVGTVHDVVEEILVPPIVGDDGECDDADRPLLCFLYRVTADEIDALIIKAVKEWWFNECEVRVRP